MESIWWVFKQLWDKGMVYRKSKVMAYSTALNTPLANFEVQLNYKEVSDPSIIIQLQTVDDENLSILAWTTTPWTLPSNTALCVHPELTYYKVKKKWDGKFWIVGKDRFAWVCSCVKKKEKDFEIIESKKGQELVGIAYKPLFNYFEDKVIKGKAWHVVSDGYVTTEAGTCIVHQAPAFGEDDNRVCLAAGVIGGRGEGLVCPVDESGCYTSDVTDFVGQHVKAADKAIIAKLKAEDKLVFSGTEVHNYPHCWRSDTPLIYKAVPSWFVQVESIRDKLIANNNSTYWVPNHVKEKRFHNWLADARDWCVSRTRYWGTPLPVWVSDDYEEMVCIGSVEELEKYAGRKITDIHRHFIDDIEIPSQQGRGTLKRVVDVFDCWFESGSMPYAQKHYPFEGEKEFGATFPADFIAEGLDQTRGWFYTLMVLATHLFDKPAFKNLIVNGLVLASDGKKMSKRLKNYPDPSEVCNKHGADAVRLYLCNSPVVKAEPLKFREEGVRDTVKDIFLPFYNAYRFFVLEAARFEGNVGTFKADPAVVKASKNIMDRWMNASKNELIQFVCDEMEAYRLFTVAPRVVAFLNNLTNWYVRLNRDRMKGDAGQEEWRTSLCTLYDVLLNVCVLLAPLTPFITEHIYQNLSRALPDGSPLKHKSVHFVMIPDAEKNADDSIVTAMSRMQSIVELGRTCRERRKVGLKQPLKGMTIINKDAAFVEDCKTLQSYLLDELNVEDVKFETKADNVAYAGEPNWKLLGKKLGKDMKNVAEAVKNLGQDDFAKFEETGEITVCGHSITSDEMAVTRSLKDADSNPDLGVNYDTNSIVVMDFSFDADLNLKAMARHVANRVQMLRKDAELSQDDPVDMWAASSGKGDLATVLVEKSDILRKLLRRPLWSASLLQGHEVCVKTEEFEIPGSDEKLTVNLTARSAFFNAQAIKSLAGGDAQVDNGLRQYVQTFTPSSLPGHKTLQIMFGEKSYTLKYNEHFTLGPADATWLK